MSSSRENFGSRFTTIMALAGSAIGLGNIWRFPYLAGEYGGAAFLLVYIIFTLLLSLPIFLAESAIGRHGGTDSRTAIASWIPGTAGRWLGMLSIITPLWVVSYYSVVGGWSLDYLSQALQLRFATLSPEQLGGSFAQLISRTWVPLGCHLLFLGITLAVVAGGVKSGIEKFSKVCMPLLFVLILFIAVYSMTLPGAGKGIAYLVKPDFSKITPSTLIAALGQSFYSLSLGMGIVITYSSYISKKENLVVTGIGTSLSDLFFAMLAGFAIMPAVFSAGIEPSSGPGLIFDTLPYIFSQLAVRMPVVSSIAAILFFLAVFIAAITSSISLMEVGVAYMMERHKMRRGWACLVLFFICGAAGCLCSLAFGPLSHVQILGKNLFDFADSTASNFLMVLGALISIIIAGWVMPRKVLFGELTDKGINSFNVKIFPVVRVLLRFVAPIGILILVLSSVL